MKTFYGLFFFHHHRLPKADSSSATPTVSFCVIRLRGSLRLPFFVCVFTAGRITIIDSSGATPTVLRVLNISALSDYAAINLELNHFERFIFFFHFARDFTFAGIFEPDRFKHPVAIQLGNKAAQLIIGK